MKIKSHIFYIVLFGLISPIYSLATHVIGGEIFYNYLGADSYYVQLRVYVDCENGNPGAISADSTGTIAIFENLTGDLKRHREIRRSSPIRLNKVQYSCVKPPKGVCVDMYIYDTIFKLKPNTFGYTVAYQRCCRNGSIINIEKPLQTGATYAAFIPPIGDNGPNSNPRFNNRPPNYLCINEQFSFDHSATDPDNDSLIYRICTPKDMLVIEPPKPAIPSAPPYRNVIWKSGFSDTLPLPVYKNFTINKEGKLLFKPKTLGQYVFAVCVDEYRSGTFLSTSWRDYQFNVMPCEFEVKADFRIPSIVCEREVLFESKSVGYTSLLWTLEKENGSTYVSEENSVNFTYNKSGEYNAQLIAKNGNCADTLEKRIKVLPKNDYENFHFDICKEDTIVFYERDFNRKPTTWINDDSLFAAFDTLMAYSGLSNAVFVHQGDYEGCAFIDSYFVNVLVSQPLIAIDTFQHCLGQVYQFELLNFPIYDKVNWSNEGANKKGSDFALMVPFNNESVVSLSLNQKHCFDSIIFNLSANNYGEPIFLKSNIISPNNDGLNDCFSPLIEGGTYSCDSYTMIIYNRWGGKVFETINANTIPCWEGENFRGGGKVQPGTYFVFVEVDGFSFYKTITVVY